MFTHKNCSKEWISISNRGYGNRNILSLPNVYSMYLQQEVRQPLTNTLVQQLPIGAFVFLVLEQTTIYVTLREWCNVPNS